MGRRNRSQKNSWEDDEDGLDRAETEWIMHRQASKKHKNSEDLEMPSTDSVKSKSTNKPIVQQDKSKDDESPQNNSNSPNANTNTSEKEKTETEDRSERLKLKKQRQKERQREKKEHRQASKRKKTQDHEVPSTNGVMSKDANDPIVVQDKSKDDESIQNNSPQNANTSEEDKIERMKLKKQRQKERQKVKKAEAALARSSAAEAKKRRSVESEKALQSKQRQEREKKAIIKERQSQQFKTLAKGVKYQDLVVGKGHTVQDRKKVTVSYTLRSKSHTSGKILDSSNNFGFRLGKSEVIKGWDIGLQDMRVGGIRRLVVPRSAGYGNRDIGAGVGADLYFEIELLHVAP